MLLEQKRARARLIKDKHSERSNFNVYTETFQFTTNTGEYAYVFFNKCLKYTIMVIDCTRPDNYIKEASEWIKAVNQATINTLEHEVEFLDAERKRADEMEKSFQEDDAFYANLSQLHPDNSTLFCDRFKDSVPAIFDQSIDME